MNIEVVKDYYGKVLKSSGDLKTSACCDGSDLPAHLKPLLANVHEEVFELDAHHLVEKGKVFPVCGNTWRMLANTRFCPHFDFVGDCATHYGIFPGCGTSPFATTMPGRRRPVGAVADAKASSGAFKGHLRSGRCFGFRLTTRVGLKT